MAENISDIVANRYEKDGYIIIKPYRRECPDLIAIPKRVAADVIAMQIKGPDDRTQTWESDMVQDLTKKGLAAFVQYLDEYGDYTSRVEEAPVVNGNKYCKKGLHEMTRKNVWERKNKDGSKSRYCRACRKATRHAYYLTLPEPALEGAF